MGGIDAKELDTRRDARSERPPAGRVLFVDDEPNVRSAFRRLLLREGIEADVAESGAEALELAGEYRYSVVVTDLAMPGMGGTMLVHRLKLAQPEATYIAVTGLKHFDAEYRKALEDEQLKVFQKPWDEERLLSTIRRALETHAVRGRMRQPKQLGETELRILLVEDNPSDAALFGKKVRAAMGSLCQIQRASTLASAVSLVETEKFDIIVADLLLPDAHGLEAVLMLQRAGPAIPLLVLTGNDDDSVAVKAVQVGAQDFLVKDQTDGALLRRSIRYSIERKQSEQHLMRMALYDQLTGLANRSLFRQRLAHAVARTRRTSESFGVMVLDLDRFKAINDALGHDAGDVLLQKVAATLLMAVRESDTVARLGGDEFAILLEPVVSQSEISVIVSRILSAISEPYDLGEDEVIVTTSIGVALYPEAGDSVDVLLKSADAAMYVAKEEGNGFHILTRLEPDAGRGRLRLERELREAVKNNELELYYQPQVTPSGVIGGAEALLRWDRSYGKPMGAETLVAILEDIGLMNAVGDWVITESCAQLRRWRGLVRRMSVNISERQLARAGFVEHVLDSLDEAELSPEQLELEVTEGMLMKAGGRAEQALRRLRAAGVRVAVDDFGTGYSSLSYLRRFPVDALKVDQSFVADLPDDLSAQSVVRAIVSMGHNLGLTVVAEGVETDDQQSWLVGAGCDLLQGFFDGKPEPANSIEWERRRESMTAPAVALP
jgi:diguanylate cyclase (GGDEF)-like protein